MLSDKITRRSFIETAAAVSAAAVVAGPLQAAPAIVLHGDGEHDDTEALQALFDGHPVQAHRPNLIARHEGGTVRLLNGSFRIAQPIRMRADINLYTGHCSFRVGDGPASPYPVLTVA